MRHRSSPPSDSSSTQALHPVLQAALDSLDVELEEELTRYRRQRYRQARQGKHIPNWQPVHEGTKGSKRSPQLPPTAVPQSEQQAMAQTAFPAEMPAWSDLAAELSPPTPYSPSTSFSPYSAAAFSAANLSNGSIAPPSGEAGRVTTARVASTQVAPEQSAPDRTLDRLRQLAITADKGESQEDALVGNEDGETTALEDWPQSWTQSDLSELSDFSACPNDYLESTEELLQSIAEESPHLSVEPETSLLDALLTPLGIGSMVLLLLSSATLGYVIMHPSSLDLFSPSEHTGENGPATGNATPFASPLIPDSPNLAAEEFVDLNVDNLSTIPGSQASGATPGLPGRSPLSSPSQSPSTAPPLPQANPSESATDAAYPSPPIAVDTAPASPAPAAPDPTSPEPTAASEPEAASPAPEPPPLEPTLPSIAPSAEATERTDLSSGVATASSPAASTGTYYVVAPYSGDPSLEQARAVVPGAYVRNFQTGAAVQLGVFSSADNAQALVQELAAKGIAAEVYQP